MSLPLARVDGIKRSLDEPDGWLIQQFRVPLAKADNLPLQLFVGCSPRHERTLKAVGLVVWVYFPCSLIYLHCMQAGKEPADILTTIAGFPGDAFTWAF